MQQHRGPHLGPTTTSNRSRPQCTRSAEHRRGSLAKYKPRARVLSLELEPKWQQRLRKPNTLKKKRIEAGLLWCSFAPFSNALSSVRQTALLCNLEPAHLHAAFRSVGGIVDYSWSCTVRTPCRNTSLGSDSSFYVQAGLVKPCNIAHHSDETYDPFAVLGSQRRVSSSSSA